MDLNWMDTLKYLFCDIDENEFNLKIVIIYIHQTSQALEKV